MNSLPAVGVEGILRWIVDFYLLATLALGLALVAGRWMRQPVRRLTLAWTTLVGLALLAAVCAMPGWPRVSLGWLAPADRTQPAEPQLTEPVATAAHAPPPRDVRPEPKSHGDHPTRNVAARDAGPDNRRADSEPVPTATVSPTNQAAPLRRIPAAIVGLFLAGVCLAVAWLAWGALATMQLCRRATAAPAALVAQLTRIVGSARPPRLLLSRRIGSAAALGLLRPTIILPAAVVEDADENGSDRELSGSLRAVLAHEWAHIRNRDLWLLALGRGLLPLLSAHPLFWWLRKQTRDDQETVADAVAARDNRPDYAAELLDWVRRTSGPAPRRVSAALGIWERPSQLTRRIAMLLDDNFQVQTSATRRWRIGTAAAVAAVGFALSMLTLQAAPPEPTLAAFDSGAPNATPTANKMPADVVQAWENAGAVAGWMGTNERGRPEFASSPAGRSGELPTFTFGKWKAGVLPKLPHPPIAFGLDLSQAQVTADGLDELAGLENLQSLYLTRTPLTDVSLTHLVGLKHLRSLDLDRTQVTDAGLKELGKLVNLRRLNLEQTYVTDVGLNELAGLDNLKTLNLSYTAVSSEGLKDPAGLQSLQSLDLFGTRVTNDGLKQLARLGSLQSLKLGMTLVTDAGLEHLVGMKNLHSLDLFAPKVTDAGMKHLAKLSGLETLNLWGAKVTDAGLGQLAALTNLRSLEFGMDKNVTDAGLKSLADLRKLESLKLGFTNVTDAGMKELAGFKNLRTLDLSSTRVTDAGLKELVVLDKLESLELYGLNVTDAGVKHLAALKSLKALYLYNTRVTDAGLKELAPLQNLKSLYLDDDKPVTDKGLKELAGLKNLQALYLKGTSATEAGVKQLQRQLPNCKIER